MAAKIATRNKNTTEKTANEDRFRVVFLGTDRDVYPGGDGYSAEEAERHDSATVEPTEIIPVTVA